MKKLLKLSKAFFLGGLLFNVLVFCEPQEEQKMIPNSELTKIQRFDTVRSQNVSYYIDNNNQIQGELFYYYSNGIISRKESYLNDNLVGWVEEFDTIGNLKSALRYRIENSNKVLSLNELRTYDNGVLSQNKSIEVSLVSANDSDYVYFALPLETDSIKIEVFDKQNELILIKCQGGNSISIPNESKGYLTKFKLYQTNKDNGVVFSLLVYKIIGDSLSIPSVPF